MEETQVAEPEVTPPAPAVKVPSEPTEADMRAIAARIDAEQDAKDRGEVYTPPVEAPTTPVAEEVPEKFKNDDGTVDVEKLQASTRQLDEAIEKKELTIEEMLSAYKEKESKFRTLPNPEKLAQKLQNQPPAPDVPLGIPTSPVANPEEEAIRKQILADFNTDPVGTMVRLAEIVSEKKAEAKILERVQPLQKYVDTAAERERENYMRASLKETATRDPRILNPKFYTEVLKEIDSEPGLLALKNPHEVAWLKVKERLRLGNYQAQPSRPVTPILGGGTPPPVPRMEGPITQQTLSKLMNTAKTPQEIDAVDKVMRDYLKKLDDSVSVR